VTPGSADTRLQALRARSQHLTERLDDAAALVRSITAVQAQDAAAAALSIRVRTNGLTREDVRSALEDDRSIVRIWAMRGTIHIVPAEDAGWLTDLLGPLNLTATHRRLTQLGVPETDRPRAVETIRNTLAEHGPLTRVELMEHVARTGVQTAGQASAHLPQLAAIDGHVCFGPVRGGNPTYALRDDWLGRDLPRLPRARALAELALRYVRAYGPAAPEDMAAWSGLPLRDARAGWRTVRSEVDEQGDDSAPAAAPPRLLPAFDTYLLGYRTRDFAVAPEHARRVWPGGGIVRPTVTLGGRAVGTWRQQRRGRRVAIAIEPFAAGDDPVDAAAEIADVGRFLGLEATG
jgi:hypothetical protein